MKNIISAVAFSAALLFPMASTAATVTSSSIEGTHEYRGGNNGLTNSLVVTDPIVTNGVLAALSTSVRTTGTAGGGPRTGRSEQTTLTQGLFEDDGFFLRSTLTSESECLQNATTGTCAPFLFSSMDLSFTIAVDEAATLYLDGTWAGGNGVATGTSIVDLFSFSVARKRPTGGVESLLSIDTNGPNQGQTNGAITGAVNLLAGQTYVVEILQRVATSGEFPMVIDSDAGQILLAGSLIQGNANIAAFGGRLDAALAAATPVPLPATAWMLIAALGGMGALRRFKRS